jgi:hypothetical protein
MKRLFQDMLYCGRRQNPSVNHIKNGVLYEYPKGMFQEECDCAPRAKCLVVTGKKSAYRGGTILNRE